MLRRQLGEPWAELRVGVEALAEDAAAAEATEVHVEALAMVGKLWRDGGELEASREALRRAYDLAVAADLRGPTAAAATSLGWTSHLLGDGAGAIRLFRHAHSILARLDDRRGMGRAWLGLAEVFKRQGDDRRARDYALRALDVAEAAGDVTMAGDACLHLGAIVAGGDPAAAMPYLHRARTQAERAGALVRLANVLNVLGDTARKAGDLAAAEAALREALVLYDEARHAWAALVRINLAVVLMEGARFAEAEVPLELAREVWLEQGHEAMLEVVDLLRLPVLAAAADEDGLTETLARIDGLDRWRRWDDECRRALRWATPLAKRAGLDALAERLVRLEVRYEEARP